MLTVTIEISKQYHFESSYFGQGTSDTGRGGEGVEISGTQMLDSTDPRQAAEGEKTDHARSGRGCPPVVRPLGSSTSCIPLFDTRLNPSDPSRGPPFISSRRRPVVLSVLVHLLAVLRLVPTGSASQSLPSNGLRRGIERVAPRRETMDNGDINLRN